MSEDAASALEQTPVVDVVMISDLRLPGGTTSSIAEEVRAQSEAGLTTALIHAAGTVTTYPNPWSAHIRGILDLPGVQIASPRSRLHARALIIRHPTVIASTPSTFEGITADHVIVVVNHAAIDAAGVQHYDVEATDTRVRELFDLDGAGRGPVWAPIGPVVRRTVEQQTRRIPLREQDWLNIFRMPGGVPRRTGFLQDRPIIGRHSRPQPGKWPATKGDILAAYPDSEAYQVEILGGAQIAEKLIGRVPQRWNVVPFGGEDPWEFLTRIDFWVYMHHPDLKEAFGRAAMEALAAGCVAIMPPYMGELFGEAAVYGEPQEVTGIIDSFWRDPQRFLEQSRKAQEFAASYNPQMHISRLEEFGIRAAAAAGTGDDVPTVSLGDAATEHTEPAVSAEDDGGPEGTPTSLREPSARSAAGQREASPPDETSWHQSLEQWASAYYGTERIVVRRTMDFAPQKAPIPRHFYDLPVLLVVMTRRCPELHAALCEGVERLREATYGFRPVAFTDSLNTATLRSMDWAVEQCWAEGDWHAFSSENWLTGAAEQLMWTQQQYGASTVIAPEGPEELQAALTHLAQVFDAPAAVLRTAQQIVAQMVEEHRTKNHPVPVQQMTGSVSPPVPIRSARGLFTGLPMGESVLLPAEDLPGPIPDGAVPARQDEVSQPGGTQAAEALVAGDQTGLITVVRRQKAYGVILAPRTSEAEQLLRTLGDLPMNQVLVEPVLLRGAVLLRDAGPLDSDAARTGLGDPGPGSAGTAAGAPSSPGPEVGTQGLSSAVRLLRAAGEALSEHGPVLLIADGLPEDVVAGAGAEGLLRISPEGHALIGEGRAESSELTETGTSEVKLVLDYGAAAEAPAAELEELLRTVQEVNARSLVEQLQPGEAGQRADGDQPATDPTSPGQTSPDQTNSGQPQPGPVTESAGQTGRPS